MCLLGQLVPAHALAHPRAQLPPAALRLVDEPGEERGNLVVHSAAAVEALDVGRVVIRALGDNRHRPSEAPVGRGDRGEIPQVDPALVVGELVVEEERENVLEVLVVRLDHLELAEQEVGERQRRAAD